jgi:hypothetical protein
VKRLDEHADESKLRSSEPDAINGWLRTLERGGVLSPPQRKWAEDIDERAVG